MSEHYTLDLNNAKTVPFEQFFQNRMSNVEFYKVKGKKCEIIKEDSNYIYFGYYSGADVYRPTAELYKTTKKEVTRKFPSYQTVEGYMVKKKVYDTVERFISKKHDYFLLKYSYNYQIKVEDGRFIVHMTCTEKPEFGKISIQNFKVILDIYTLKVNEVNILE